jgi:selenocysteine-specific elongation factor
MRVIGTAGHIDHGKSTLVKRLTGIDPDRLAEEKQRGMTIDLGFAWFTLPSGIEVSIVDVPGHERFVRNMLAGIGGVDLVLLVIAADEGVMPQTREHLDILDLLGVQLGIVVLSKIDLIEDDWLDLVREDVDQLLADTTLAGSAVIPVSTVTGEGMAPLIAVIDYAVHTLPQRSSRDIAYVPVDRVFTRAGFGTVVTGTLHDGELTVGQEVEVLPRHTRGRIRSLQTHQRRVDRAEPGTRVAVNLAGLDRDEIKRGHTLALPGAITPVRRFDAQVRVLGGAPFPLKHGSEVRLHIGSAECSATLSVLGANEIPPGESGWVQVRLDMSVAVVRGQRFIIRLPAPARTIAGGEVVDITPRHRRSDESALHRLSQLTQGKSADTLLAVLADGRRRTAAQIASVCGLQPQEVRNLLAAEVTAGRVVKVGRLYLQRSSWDEIVGRTATVLAEYHQRNPLRRGMHRDELGQRVGVPMSDWPAAVALLVAGGTIVVDGTLIAAAGHSGGIGAQRSQADRVLAVLAEDQYAPPGAAELLARADASVDLLNAMFDAGEIVRVTQDVYFVREAYERMVSLILETIDREGNVTVARVRDLFGTSRKYALALLDHLDAERVTRRVGDVRVAGSRRPACA